MAIEFDIQVRNGTVKITVGGSQTNSGNALDQGGSSPGNSSGNTGGGGPDGGSGSGCGGPVIIGPIVVDGASLQPGTQGLAGQGGSSPGNSSGNTGGGGPGPGGSGPGCPVIIGPIVISGCSGQASDPPVLSDAQQIAVSPPFGVHAKGLAGAFNMQTQDETDWCWAAVAVSINAYLDPPADPLGNPTWTQASLATQVLAQELQWNPAVDCTADPNEECDRPAGLNDALSIAGNLMAGGYRSNCFLDFASIQSWMDQQLPVGARIQWPGGGAHFVALSGYQVFASGEQKVVVEDPLYGPSVQDYSSLRGQYIYNGSWNDTYLVTP
jgi:hypothetical protein